jgi:hypothetical protein
MFLLTMLLIAEEQWMLLRLWNYIYMQAVEFMHGKNPELIGKQEGLYLWCYIRGLKTTGVYTCPIHTTCTLMIASP